MALLEILRLDAEIDDLIARHATLREMETAARKKGFRTLADDGARKVWEGLTSLDEISRVVDLTTRVQSG